LASAGFRRPFQTEPLPAAAGSLFSLTFMSRKLHLKALLRLRNSIERGERNLKLLRARAADCDDRHHAQPLRYLKGSFLRFHSPTALVGTSFRDANALNLELCSCKADRSAERIGFTSPFSACRPKQEQPNPILESACENHTRCFQIIRAHSMEQTPYKRKADAVAPHRVVPRSS
jgi:hypothetical protein